MRKSLSLLSAFLLGALSTQAQTDVTSTYIPNADFSQGTPVSSIVRTYAKDVASGEDGSSLLDVAGWTAGSSGDAKAGGLFSYGSSAALGSVGNTCPATNPNGGVSGNALGIVAVWTGEASYTTAASELPAGKYTVTFEVYCLKGTAAIAENHFGFVATDGTTYYGSTTSFTVGAWLEETVEFTLGEATSGAFSIGYKAPNSGSGYAQHLFIDNVKVEYLDPLSAVKAEYEEALATANDALAGDDYANVTGEEREALHAAAEATVDEETEAGYQAATAALSAAISTFTAAKTAYDLYAAEKANAAAIDATLVADIADPASAAEASESVLALIAAENDATGAYTQDATEAAGLPDLSAWTFTSTTGAAASTNTGQHWSGDDTAVYYEQSGSSWGASSFTDSYATSLMLPAGSYLLKLAARASTGVSLTASASANGATLNTAVLVAKGDTGLGIDTEGNVNFDESGTYANNGAGRGWEWRYVAFTLDETATVSLAVTGVSASSHQWFSIGNLSLLTTEDNGSFSPASEEELQALQDAIATVEEQVANNVIGFGEGEYSPYNNAAILQALADAKAVAALDAPASSVVVAATEALLAAEWVVNETEVNAIFDGTLIQKAVSAKSGDADAEMHNGGWTNTTSFRLILGDEDKYLSLAQAEDGRAVFAWGPQTLSYGEKEGYTMPLDPNTIYELSFKYCGWDGNNGVNLSASVLNSAGEGLQETALGISYGAVSYAGNFANAKLYFRTGAEAANYVLAINLNTNTTLTDFRLIKAQSALVAVPAANANEEQSAYYVTYVTETAVDLDQCDFQAYAVNVESGSSISYSQVSGTVSAGTPLLICAASAGDHLAALGLSSDTEQTSFETELLRSNGSVQGDGASIYTLGNGEYGLGWYLYEEGATVPDGTCYLKVEGTGGAEYLTLEGTATAISAVAKAQGADAARHNLAGQRVGADYKGIVIVGGKKYLNK